MLSLLTLRETLTTTVPDERGLKPHNYGRDNCLFETTTVWGFDNYITPLKSEAPVFGAISLTSIMTEYMVHQTV